jgi:hypothetical protein
MYYRNANFANSSMSNRQSQLSNAMRRLWMEHVMWTRSFIISTAANLGDLQFVTKRLLRNPDDFADMLRPLYGNENAMKFKNFFTDHLMIAAELVNAAKAGDKITADAKREKWYQNAEDIANVLSEINSYWNRNIWLTMLSDHLNMTENEAVQILTGQYDASITQYDAIQKEALEMADYMSSGIIRQFNF